MSSSGTVVAARPTTRALAARMTHAQCAQREQATTAKACKGVSFARPVLQCKNDTTPTTQTHRLLDEGDYDGALPTANSPPVMDKPRAELQGWRSSPLSQTTTSSSPQAVSIAQLATATAQAEAAIAPHALENMHKLMLIHDSVSYDQETMEEHAAARPQLRLPSPLSPRSDPLRDQLGPPLHSQLLTTSRTTSDASQLCFLTSASSAAAAAVPARVLASSAADTDMGGDRTLLEGIAHNSALEGAEATTSPRDAAVSPTSINSSQFFGSVDEATVCRRLGMARTSTESSAATDPQDDNNSNHNNAMHTEEEDGQPEKDQPLCKSLTIVATEQEYNEFCDYEGKRQRKRSEVGRQHAGFLRDCTLVLTHQHQVILNVRLNLVRGKNKMATCRNPLLCSKDGVIYYVDGSGGGKDKQQQQWKNTATQDHLPPKPEYFSFNEVELKQGDSRGGRAHIAVRLQKATPSEWRFIVGLPYSMRLSDLHAQLLHTPNDSPQKQRRRSRANKQPKSMQFTLQANETEEAGEIPAAAAVTPEAAVANAGYAEAPSKRSNNRRRSSSSSNSTAPDFGSAMATAASDSEPLSANSMDGNAKLAQALFTSPLNTAAADLAWPTLYSTQPLLATTILSGIGLASLGAFSDSARSGVPLQTLLAPLSMLSATHGGLTGGSSALSEQLTAPASESMEVDRTDVVGLSST